MSILIRGMEMPKDGEMLCVNIYPDGKVCINLDLECKQAATAVPVPPHGDLIDRDPFIEFIKTHWNSYGQWFVKQLKARPTIIPTEEGET